MRFSFAFARLSRFAIVPVIGFAVVSLTHAQGLPDSPCRQVLSANGSSKTIGLVIEDFDGDGLDDVAMAYTSPTPGHVVIYRNLGGSKLVKKLDITPGFSDSQGAYSLEDGDFDGDGDADLAVGSYTPPAELKILWNNGAWSFGSGPLIDLTNYGPYTGSTFYPEAANFDQDAEEEMVVTSTSYLGSGVVWYIDFDTATSDFDVYAIKDDYLSLLYSPTDVSAIDLNADGDEDFIMAGGTPESGSPDYPNSFIEVWLNNGTTTPPFDSTPDFHLRFGKNLYEIDAARIDGDTLLDIVVTEFNINGATSGHGWYWLPNHGTATAPVFDSVKFVADPGRQLFGLILDTLTGNDGLVDVAVTRRNAKQIALWRNTGSGFVIDDSINVSDSIVTSPALLEITQLHSGGAREIIFSSGSKGAHVLTVDADGCMCDCHTDPNCDGQYDILDYQKVYDVAFRSAPAVIDPNSCCPRKDTDVDCDGDTDAVDVTKMLHVVFWGSNPATEFCQACP